jgi:hypothetical protein
MEIDWMRIALEKLDPVDNCELPEPWYLQDPWEALDPWRGTEGGEKFPPMPMTLGPASRFGSPVSNPMSVEAPGIDTGTSLAARLSWKLPKKAKQRST